MLLSRLRGLARGAARVPATALLPRARPGVCRSSLVRTLCSAHVQQQQDAASSALATPVATAPQLHDDAGGAIEAAAAVAELDLEQPDAGLPPGLTDDAFELFCLEQWENPRSRTNPRRSLYKLQRALQVADLWPLQLANRLEEKQKLLGAVQRLAARGLLSKERQDEAKLAREAKGEDDSYSRVGRLELRIAQLRIIAEQLTVESVADPPLPEKMPPRRNRRDNRLDGPAISRGERQRYFRDRDARDR